MIQVFPADVGQKRVSGEEKRDGNPSHPCCAEKKFHSLVLLRIQTVKKTQSLELLLKKASRNHGPGELAVIAVLLPSSKWDTIEQPNFCLFILNWQSFKF